MKKNSFNESYEEITVIFCNQWQVATLYKQNNHFRE